MEHEGRTGGIPLSRQPSLSEHRLVYRIPVARIVLGAAMMVTALGVAAILGFLVYFAWPLVAGGQLAQIISWRWQPFGGHFGILPMLIGSIGLTLTAVLTAYPLALGLCGFVHGAGRGPLVKPVLGVIHLMTGIPTVVYGFVAVFVLVPRLRQWLGGTGYSWLAASLTLSLLILPTIVLLIHTQLRQTDSRVRLAAMALGFSPVQELLWVRLPQASRGLWAGLVLGWSRALGDTLIALMLSGNAPQVPHSLADSLRVLTAHIALVVATDAGSAAYHSIFACGLILFGLSAAVNLTLRRLQAPGTTAGYTHVPAG